jgi:hypothetical protein
MESAPGSNPAAQDNIDQVPSWREVFLAVLDIIAAGILKLAAASGLWPST